MGNDKNNTAKPHILMLLPAGVDRDALIALLRGEFEILIADDDETAWVLLNDIEDINLLICGLDGPASHGLDLIKRVRAAEPAHVQSVPVLAITGLGDAATREAALAAGATDFVTTPVDPVQFVARTRAQVKLDRTARSLASAERAIESGGTEDSTTGTASKRYFEQKGGQDLALALRHREALSVLRVDIDNFKAFYKDQGDEAADNLLVWVANLLKKQCRKEDTVSRISGAEFAVLAPKTDASQALQLCARLRAAASAQAFQSSGKPVPVTFSVGVAVAGSDPELDIEGLLRLAGTRATEARAKGGNTALAGEAAQMPEPAPAATGSAKVEKPGGSEIKAEEGLKMLANHKEDSLEPHIIALLLELVPLLEFGNQRLNLSIGFAIAAMKKRLEDLRDYE